MAAVLTAGPETVLSHRSAAALWGMLPPSSVAIEVTRPTRLRSRPGLRAHRSALRPDEITRVDGIPVSTVSRTLFDLAAIGNRRQVENAFNEAEVRGLTDRLSVPMLLERYPRRRGTRMLRQLTDGDSASRGVTRLELEERFKEVLDRTDLPRPRLNADVAVSGQFFEVDCLWAEQRLIVELDGRAVHGTRRAFEKDREKDRLLQVAGWRVVRVTWRQMHDDGPALVTDLGRMLRP